MPELPEVERAAALIRSIAIGRKVSKVETTEDLIVFSGASHLDFAKEITGRTVLNANRYGKVFYIELDGKGKMPVLHFGMTGMLQVKGELATFYKEVPKGANTDWPPRFMKFILHLTDGTTTTEVAFMDVRRLGRIRLCSNPLSEPPISDLGFDPVLSMPSFDEFRPLVLKRSCPIKALLLDQSFSAGVGNWVADEILYHARVHPEQRCNTLTDEQVTALHKQTFDVCRIAVEVNADDSKFPSDWLFKHRWGKGKKKKHDMKLPSGEPATIQWLTVGGRTSAYVSELQRLPGKTIKAKIDPEDGTESDLTTLSDSEGDGNIIQQKKRKSPSKAVSLLAQRRKTTARANSGAESQKVMKLER